MAMVLSGAGAALSQAQAASVLARRSQGVDDQTVAVALAKAKAVRHRTRRRNTLAAAADTDPAHAVLPGFDQQVFGGNDDGSMSVTLPFPIRFFGQDYSAAYLNNNGNLTFDRPLPTYTPYPLSNQGPAMIAAFFGDVDTRVGNPVTYGAGTVDGHRAFGVTWPQVACYDRNGSVSNTFQLLLIERADTGPGQFDAEFNYDSVQWDSGQASGGNAECRNGQAARAGYASGSGETGSYYELPGSGVNDAFLDSNAETGLIHGHYGSIVPGRYIYSFHNGAPSVTSGAPEPATGIGRGQAVEHDPTCTVARPVNCASGNFWHSFSDLTIPERVQALDISRTYNSLDAAKAGAFGYGWSWSMGDHLDIAADGSITITLSDGSSVTAQPSGQAYVLPTWASVQLNRGPPGQYVVTYRHKIRKTFDSSGRLLAVSDLNGNSTQLTYDGSALRRITDPAGRQIATATDAAGHITSLTDPAGKQIHFEYNAAGELTASVDRLGRRTAFTYDSGHALLTMKDPRGGVTTNEYDAAHRVTLQTDPLGRATRLAYAGDNYTARGGTTDITNPGGDVTSQRYANGELQSLTTEAGTTRAATYSFAYDPVSLGVSSSIDPLGHETTTAYDPAGNAVERVDGLGRSSHATFDALGDPLTTSTPGGRTTTSTYDANGNLLTVRDAANDVTTIAHGDARHPSDVTAVTDRDGRRTDLTYGAEGLLATVSVHPTAGVADTTHFAYDALGRQTCRVSAVATQAGVVCGGPGAATTNTYDAEGNLLSSTDASGRTTTSTYDGNDNRLTSVVGGRATTNTYDADDELVKTQQPDGVTTTSAYDDHGNRVASSDGAGKITAYTFDARNHQLTMKDPLGRTTSFAYDAAGRRTMTTDATGRTTTEAYDDADEVTAIDYSDPATPDAQVAYDEDGHRISMTDGTGRSTYTYDVLGRLADLTNGAGATTRYGYDRSGDLTRLTYPTGKTVIRGYDGAGELTGITDWLGKTFTFAYDADGNETRQEDPNGAQAAYGFDASGQMTSISDTSGGRTVADLRYTRNSAAQVTGVQQAGDVSHTYTYDPEQRLASDNDQAYGYDRASNPVRLSDGTAQTFDAAGELTSSEQPAAVSAPAADVVVSADAGPREDALVSPPMATHGAELLVAFVAADVPTGPDRMRSTVTGGGLTWKLVASTGKAHSVNEVWEAYAPRSFSDKVTAVVPRSVRDGSITVAAFANSQDHVGAVASAADDSTTATASLTTTGPDSLVWANGYDASRAQTWTPATGQTTVHSNIDARRHDTFWTQRTDTIPNSHTEINASATAGHKGKWQMVAVEILGATGAGGTSDPDVDDAPGKTEFTYDSTGNRITAAHADHTTDHFTYDQANRLIAADSAHYVYSGDGLRASKTVSGHTTAYSWQQNSAIPMLLSDGDTSYVYGPDGLPLEQVTGTTPTYLLHDQQGSTRILLDGAGAVTGSYTYSAYGKVTGHTGSARSNVQFAGQYRDAETGFLYLRARYYDPQTSVFISRDPLVNLTTDPYHYGGGDPLTQGDPTGLLHIGTWFAGIGALIGFGAIVLGLFELPAIAVLVGLIGLIVGVIGAVIDCADGLSRGCAIDLIALSFGSFGLLFDIFAIGFGGALLLAFIGMQLDMLADMFAWIGLSNSLAEESEPEERQEDYDPNIEESPCLAVS